MEDIKSDQADLDARLDELLSPWNRSDAPGVAVGVRHQGQTMFRAAYGMASLEAKRALSCSSRIRIGSTSKHMTALLTLLLAEEGLLDLDAPLKRYLSELGGPEGEATIRLHLQHRSGGRCYFDLSAIMHLDCVTPDDRPLELAIRQEDRNFEPGTAMIYCNSAYHLVSLAIERVLDQPFEQALHERLFTPLGMHETESLRSDHAIRPGLATLHVPTEDGSWRRGLFPVSNVMGEGGVISTIDDMLRWTAHLSSHSKFGSSATWSQLLERPKYADGASGNYALGLIHAEHRGRPTILHAGGVIGGLSQLLLLPDEDLEIVILANGAPDLDPVGLAYKIADLVLGEEGSDAQGGEAPEALLGHWFSHEDGMIYSIDRVEGRLLLGVAGGPPSVPINQNSDGEWVAEGVTISPLNLNLGQLDRGSIDIEFGGLTSIYRQGDGSAPAQLPSRSFASHDADGKASFIRSESADLLLLSDAFGKNEMALKWLDQRTALATSTRKGMPFTASILLDEDGDTFTLNTARTRWLKFK